MASKFIYINIICWLYRIFWRCVSLHCFHKALFWPLYVEIEPQIFSIYFNICSLSQFFHINLSGLVHILFDDEAMREINIIYNVVVNHWIPKYRSNLIAPLQKCEKVEKTNIKICVFKFNKIIIFPLTNFYKQVMAITIQHIHKVYTYLLNIVSKKRGH